jgi:soluble lytic murein transglycosylase
MNRGIQGMNKYITATIVAISMLLMAATPAVKPAHHKLSKKDLRIIQARELLGPYYQHSVVKTGEQVSNVPDFVQEEVKASLQDKYKKEAKKLARTIVKQSQKYELDPIFIMAIIDHESSFNPSIKGSFGEIGLMQIKPDTAEWIAKKYHLQWKGEKSLYDPSTNVIYGTAYINYLRERFSEHGRLYLAAYNMGVTNVNRALGKDIWPKDYPSKVMQHYVKFYAELRKTLNKGSKSSQKLIVANQDRNFSSAGFIFLPTGGDLDDISAN